MRFLVDAVLPATLSDEAPSGVEYIRWQGGGDQDVQLIRTAAEKGYRGVIFFDRNSLAQPGLAGLAEALGVALVAVEAADPIEAKERILLHTAQLRRELANSQFVLILGSEVRSFEPPSIGDPVSSDPPLTQDLAELPNTALKGDLMNENTDDSEFRDAYEPPAVAGG